MRDHCPVRLASDCGGGYVIGLTFGFLKRTYNGIRKGRRIEKIVRSGPTSMIAYLLRFHWRKKMLRPARRFARWTLFFAFYECSFIYLRGGVDDIINPVMAGGFVNLTKRYRRRWKMTQRTKYPFTSLLTGTHTNRRWFRRFKRRFTAGALFLALIEGAGYILMEMLKTDDAKHFVDPFFIPNQVNIYELESKVDPPPYLEPPPEDQEPAPPSDRTRSLDQLD